MRINAATFEKWVINTFSKSELSDITNYGANAGFTGLTYYKDTCKLYNKFKEEIWRLLREDADAMGINIFEMLNSFRGIKDVDSAEHFENLMTWYAAERVAYNLVETMDDDA